MRLWMSRSAVTHQYAFWSEQPDVTWSDQGEVRIGYGLAGTEKHICEMINVHKLFPALELPPGEMVEVEVIALENGYYIGFVE